MRASREIGATVPSRHRKRTAPIGLYPASNRPPPASADGRSYALLDRKGRFGVGWHVMNFIDIGHPAEIAR